MDATHIDTCLSCYLQDHHNRPGELLLGVVVDGTTTFREIKDELLSELNGLMIDSESFDYDEARKAIGEAFLPIANLDDKFDASLDVPGEDEDFADPCQAWFLLEWEEEEVS